ncbi:MAG: adenylosuccinate lyase [bacterium]|nr:adenylosuccinate lyase [bacterium]
MIERYSLPEMKSIWTDEAKFKRWLEVELTVLQVREEMGIYNIPIGTTDNLKKQIQIDITRINEIEKTTNHDVIAFVTQITENCGTLGRYIHYGLTSSDVIDTALGMTLRDGCNILEEKLQTLISTLQQTALQHRSTIMMGRTHGMHAEPITFGIKVAGWVDELNRNLARFNRAKEAVSVGKLSGAVGTYSLLTPEIELKVMKKLGLKVASHSTQIVPRDRYAELLSVFALIGGALERIALEIRHGQRNEISELSEPFGKGQRGSSAMPHKKNPILCERICGCARLLRSYALVGFENQALWMERDISHSSTERIILPDAFQLLDYMLYLMNKIVGGLVVDTNQMKRIVRHFYDVHFSQKILTALIDQGYGRDEAYTIVQNASFQAKEKKISLLTIAKNNNWWSLPNQVVQEILSVRPDKYWRNIYKRAGIPLKRGGK